MRLYSEGETVDLYLAVKFSRVDLEEVIPPFLPRDRPQTIHGNTKTTPDITIPRHPTVEGPLTNKPLLPLVTEVPEVPEVTLVTLVVPLLVN